MTWEIHELKETPLKGLSLADDFRPCQRHHEISHLRAKTALRLACATVSWCVGKSSYETETKAGFIFCQSPGPVLGPAGFGMGEPRLRPDRNGRHRIENCVTSPDSILSFFARGMDACQEM